MLMDGGLMLLTNWVILFKNIQNVLSSKFSNKWLLGEILHNGEHWLDNELLSGITNHHWHEIVIKFITGNGAQQNL